MVKRVFISTAIPYVNGDPHAGHSLEYVQTDVMARYYRLKYGEQNVLALTGTDENALKNVLAAEKEGMETSAYVDRQVAEFKKLYEILNLSFDEFFRTTEKRHFAGAQKLWKAIEHDIYEDSYEGLYCVGCEEFKDEKDLIEGLCPEHRTKPERVKEKNYFFRLSKYQQQIEELIESDKVKIIPEKRKNEVLGFVKEGLKDFSISRSVERAKGWGVPVPGDPEQIVYVWVDALSNYITALDYADNGARYQKFWDSDEVQRVHVIGKGILKFHALYWMGMLLSAGLPLPSLEYAHGYVTIEGKKIGKSLGNAIHPKEIVEKYGVDAFRYYLLREIPWDGDGDFSWSRMDEVYQADLQNGLGNLVARVAAMCEKEKFCVVDKSWNGLTDEVEVVLSKFQFDQALEMIWKKVRAIDRYISEKKVWQMEKEEKQKALSYLVKEIRQVTGDISPFLPETAEKIKKQFKEGKIVRSEALFPRLG